MKNKQPEYHRVCIKCDEEIYYSDNYFRCNCYLVTAIDNNGLLMPMFWPHFWILRELINE